MYIDKSKAKKHQVQYRTSIVVAVRRRWWCPSLSVVSGGCPSPCVTVGPQWWSSIAVVVGGPRWWLSITIRRRWWSCSLCIIVHHYCLSLVIIVRRNPSPSPSPSIAIAVAICRQSLLSIVSHRRRSSLSVVIVGLRRWSSSLVVSHHHCGCRRLVVGCRRWLSVIIIVAVGHGRECNRCATSHGRCTSIGLHGRRHHQRRACWRG